ncbi:hypothetical protein QJS10_CPB19g00418 [Acorus calamus]|uniref:PORR domain-containing protein n=1 Tax=Acorus calamus TaxID=4465 RepID=A0AAV9CH04_ACOCL|nr:hypothetical protein QJS10_CPB19g00418 [Acorus calamus]
MKSNTLRATIQTLTPLLSKTPTFRRNPTSTYVDVYMKWKRDPLFESIDTVSLSPLMKPLLSLKNTISRHPNLRIPISSVSKRTKHFETPHRLKVATFMRRYPSFFHESSHDAHPWFSLTRAASALDIEERALLRASRADIARRVYRLVRMSRDNHLPLSAIKGLQWNLGFPDELLEDPIGFSDGLLEPDRDGLRATTTDEPLRPMVSDAAFSLFPMKGVRLKRKIEEWLEEFQRVPYVSPYEDFSHIRPDSDVGEKRVVGVLHELLGLFVDHSVERRRLFGLKKALGLPQKVHRVFERHPLMFYLSFKNRTCTVILKEAYSDEGSKIERHPLIDLRRKYVELMKESSEMLKARQRRRCGGEAVMDEQSEVLEDQILSN